MPLRNDHVASYGSSAVRDVVLVELSTPDGVVGWGECPTFDIDGYVTETTDAAWSALRDELVPEFLDRGGPGAGPMFGMSPVFGMDGHGAPIPVDPRPMSTPSAAFASLADACLDNQLRRRGRGLAEVLDVAKHSVDRTVVIAAVGADPGVIGRRAEEAVQAGAALVKIKVTPGHDTDVVGAVTRRIGASRVAVDANGSYVDPSQLNDLDALGLAYIEQPFDASVDWSALGVMSRQLATPVALDESIRDATDLESCASKGAARIVSIKPARVGGIIRASQLVRQAHGLGLDVFVGGMVELGIGRAGATAVAAMGDCSMPTDLGPSEQYFDLDVTEPAETDPEGRLMVPGGLGIGRVPIPEMLERFCVDRLSLA